MNTVKFIEDSQMMGFDSAFNPARVFFKKNCFLKDFYFSDRDIADVSENAGNFINAWCSKFNINQRAVLARLQVEQGLLNITNVSLIKKYWKFLLDIKKPDGSIVKGCVNQNDSVYNPREGETITSSFEMNPLDWACGCGVPDFDPPLSAYQGFSHQIRGCCRTYSRWYALFKKDVPMDLVNEPSVIPANAASYALLRYTPHVSAGSLFAKVYDELFGLRLI